MESPLTKEDFVLAEEGYYYNLQMKLIISSEAYNRLPSRGGKTQFADLTKDPLYLIALRTDLPSLLALCQTSKRYAQICADDFFWQARTIQDYPYEARRKPEDVSWKKYYEDVSSGRVFIYGLTITTFQLNPPQIVSKFLDIPTGALDIACDTRILIAARNGCVYGLGNTEFGQIVMPQNRIRVAGLTVIPGLRDIVQVSTGSYNSGAITRDGRLFMLGAGKSLGVGTRMNQFIPHPPTELVSLGKVKSVSVGGFHALVTTQDGRVFTLANNARPREIPIPGDVLKASAGEEFSAILTRDGKVYTFGEGQRVALGRDGPANIPDVVRMPGGMKAIDLDAGAEHTAVILEDGRVATFGSNAFGKLGRGGDRLRPSIVEGLEDIRSVSCGEYHTLALDARGVVFGFGSNRYSEITPDDTPMIITPRRLTHLQGRVKKICAGNSFSAVIL